MLCALVRSYLRLTLGLVGEEVVHLAGGTVVGADGEALVCRSQALEREIRVRVVVLAFFLEHERPRTARQDVCSSRISRSASKTYRSC